MKILYAGTLSRGNSARYRIWALERLGHAVVPFEIEGYEAAGRVMRKVEFRLAMGPSVRRMNEDLLRVAEQERVEVFWSDKLLKLRPETLDRMRAMGVFTVSYMIDNAFGPRKDPGWRLYVKDIPHFDLHVTQREVSLADYEARGARAVMKVQTAYEPTMHYPPPAGWGDKDRDREVSFVGTPYGDRAGVLERLGREEVQVTVSGRETAWRKAMSAEAMKTIFFGGLLYDDEYREAIWRSKINLSFLTRANLDEYTHKSFEVAGCGGFLLAERCAGHSARFVEDEEAVFFAGYDELKAKILRYLPDEAGRARIAAAGCARAERDGYHNDRQVGLIVERIEEMRRVRG